MACGARHRSTVDSAVRFLRRHLQDTDATHGGRLPTLQALAERAGVSLITMHRAVARLKGEGLLDVAPRRGIWVTGGGAAVESAEPDDTRTGGSAPSHKWQHVKSQLAADVMRGAFGPRGELPSSKELCGRYDVCSHTMRKALRSLAGEGKIRPLRHGYTFGHTARFSYGTIVIIAQHHHIGLLSTRVPYVASFFTTLEQEQRRLGFNVHTVMSGFFYDRTEAEVRNRTTFAEIEKAHATIGYLVLATGHRDHRIRRILQDAQAIGKPVALLDGTGFCERNDVPRYRNVRAFPLKTQDAGPGADMGSYLLSRGHRHAAYFTYEPEPLWSKRRFAGLRRAFSPEAGMTSLHSFLVPAVNARELERRQASGEHADLYRLEGAHFRGRYLKPADEFLRVRSSARAAFEAAALVPEITAWIAGNDALALQAWYYLRRDNPHVPPERALCGFDNSFDAFAHGITSYDFNSSSALHAMLEFVLAADTRGGERVVEVPGGLVKRQSTEGRAVRVAERL